MIAALIGALVLAAQAATPVDPAAAPPAGKDSAKAAKPASDPNRIVCKTEATTGSLFPTRTCRTQAAWDALREEGQRLTQDIQTRALGPSADAARSH